jgi:hypothetical protein
MQQIKNMSDIISIRRLSEVEGEWNQGSFD